MKTKLLLPLVAIGLCFSLGIHGQSFRLKGTSDKVKNGENIMLFTFLRNKIHTVDTAKVENNCFAFTGKEYLGDMGIITYGNYPDTVWSMPVILDKGDISVRLGVEDWRGGTPLNNKYQMIIDSLNNIHFEGNRLRSLLNNGTDSLMIIHKIQELYAGRNSLVTQSIKENMYNPMGKVLLSNDIYIIPKEDMAKIIDVMNDSLKSDPTISELLANRKTYEEKLEKREQSVGKPFIDYQLTDADGNTRLISDYVGKSKYLFIDFWASWCGPCVREIPGIKEVYAKYKDQGLTVLSISVDNNEKAWKASMKKLDMPWANLCSLEGGDELMNLYHIKGIPYGILIDDKGIVIGHDIRISEALEVKLKELINNN